MRTGWKVLLCLIAAAVLSTAALSALEPLTDQAATRNYLSRQLGVNIGDCPVLRDRDTHGGFHGDGERLIVADCSSRRAELMDQTRELLTELRYLGMTQQELLDLVREVCPS